MILKERQMTNNEDYQNELSKYEKDLVIIKDYYIRLDEQKGDDFVMIN